MTIGPSPYTTCRPGNWSANYPRLSLHVLSRGTPGSSTPAWHPPGRLFLTASLTTRLINVWDGASGIRRFTLDGHQGGIASLAVDPAIGLLASMSWAGPD